MLRGHSTSTPKVFVPTRQKISAMSDVETTVAVVGACGGAGATRITVEAAGSLARAGRDVAVLDVATGTQGLAGAVQGHVDPDLTTALLADDGGVDEALVDIPLETPGTLAVAPTRAPFERVARAQTADAARSLTDAVAALEARFDHVLLDAPPVTTNLAVAAVTEADRVASVAPPGQRGADAVQRVRGRLADVGAPSPTVVVNEGIAGGGEGLQGDLRLPEGDVRELARTPTVVDPDATFAPAVARVVEAVAGVDLDLAFPEGGLLGSVL